MKVLGTTLIDYHYDYNHNGQLSQQKGEPELDASQLLKPVDMSYDADNRLIQYNGVGLDYDANNNLLNSPFGNYTYDSRNRLTSAGNLTYAYDPENRRIAIDSPQGTTQLVHNPNALLSQLLVRKTPDGKSTYYVYGLGLLYQETDNQALYYHYDHQGNTLLLTDQNGQVTDQFSYSPYGELISRNGTTDTPFQYNARFGVMTDDNGLLQMRARYYSPQLKRFLNQDILLGNIAEPLTLNRFAYANGDPINNIDPFGLAALDSTGGWFQGFMNLYNNLTSYVIPGQAAWLNAMDSLYQGYYLNAGIFAFQTLAEQVLTALSFGSYNPAVTQSATVIEQGYFAVLKNGYYEVNGLKFSKYYYEKLWSTGRGAPSLVVNEILATGAKGVPDTVKAGFFRYEAAGWEMIYNPITKEVWHLQPL